MWYHFAADVIVVLHLAFIVFAICGGVLALRSRWAPWVHLPAAVWAGFVAFSGAVCPLTPLENTLRRAAGDAGYAGGFIDHYVTALVYPAGLTRELQVVFGCVVVAANLGLYCVVWWKTRNTRPSER